MMSQTLPERDWKYIKSIHDEMLCALCDRINRESSALLASREGTAHARYLRLYKHIQESDSVIGDCFNDLKRSNLVRKICSMKRAGILKPDHQLNLSPGAQEILKAIT